VFDSEAPVGLLQLLISSLLVNTLASEVGQVCMGSGRRQGKREVNRRRASVP
jgi:hypothetical protein